jgi:hypothetical protein
MRTVKGMVLVDGNTYRIVRVAPSQYDVVRVLDDVCVGEFHSAPQLRVVPHSIEAGLLREIALSAIRGAKTSWVGLLATR